MKCEKCGLENIEGKFCKNCGNALPEVKVDEIQEEQVASEKLDFVKFGLGMLLKPVTTIKKYKANFDDFKNSAILTAIISLVIMVIALVFFIFTMGRTAIIEGGWFGIGGEVVGYEWNLGEVPWVSVIIGIPLLVFTFVALTAVVYFVAGKIVKKDLSYPRLFGLIAGCAIPLTATIILGSIFGLASAILASIVIMVGSLYSYIITVYTITSELKMEDTDQIIYLHLGALVTLSILLGIALSILTAVLLEAIITGGTLDLYDFPF